MQRNLCKRVAAGLGSVATLLVVPALALAWFGAGAWQALGAPSPQRAEQTTPVTTAAAPAPAADALEEWDDTASAKGVLAKLQAALKAEQKGLKKAKGIKATAVKQAIALTNAEISAINKLISSHKNSSLGKLLSEFAKADKSLAALVASELKTGHASTFTITKFTF